MTQGREDFSYVKRELEGLPKDLRINYKIVLRSKSLDRSEGTYQGNGLFPASAISEIEQLFPNGVETYGVRKVFIGEDGSRRVTLSLTRADRKSRLDLTYII